MNKISANVKERNVIDLDYSVKKNIDNLAQYNNKKPEELTVCILDRPRHEKIIEELKNLKELLDTGVITQDEFDKAKKKVLN